MDARASTPDMEPDGGQPDRVLGTSPMEQAWTSHVRTVAWPTVGLFFVLMVATVAIPSAAVTEVLSVWVAGGLMVGVSYLWFTPLHEAIHSNIGGRTAPWLDTAIGWVSALCMSAAPYSAFKAIHLRHHSAVNEPGEDPDHFVAGSNLLTSVVRCLLIVPYFHWMTLSKLAWESTRSRARIPSYALFVAAVGAGVWLATSHGYGSLVVGVWLIPGWLASALLVFVFDYVPHHPHDKRGRFDNARIILSPWLTLGLLGQNYHLVHHLWPRVPFYRYGALFKEVQGQLADQGAPVYRLERGRLVRE